MPEKSKNQLQKEQLKRMALDMYNDGMPQVRIAQEIGIGDSTLRRWLREMKIPPKKHRHEPNKVTEVKDRGQDALEENLSSTLKDAIKIEKGRLRTEEDKAIMEHAEVQTTPAEKYQSYVTASAVKLMRDSLKLIRPAKTIRELDQLDQIIRRNFGLDAKGGAAGSKLSIDVSILTNTKTALNGGAVKTAGHIIDVTDVVETKKEDSDGESDEEKE